MAATESKGAVLLPLARAAIATELGQAQVADGSAPWLREPGACFVTLTQGGDLRGCIGTLQPHRALHDDVRSNARAAAFEDPRFAPLSARELDRTRIEVSLLSAMEEISFASEAEALAALRPGLDGVVFSYAGRRSTFLPQVWDQLPAVDDFIAHLKRKAGLPAGFWHAEVRLQRYTVSKWREGELTLAH
jgi:uncharacterized protein